MQKEKQLVPKLRFSGFEKEWEREKLGNVAEFSKGKGISKSDIIEDGKNECIRYGELYTTYNETINSIKSKTNTSLNISVLSEENDVIIPSSGETQLDIATASCLLRSGVILGGDLNIIKSELNGVFLSYLLNNSKKKDIARLAQGNSVVHLYNKQLSSLKLNVPTLREQQKIANFLTSVDTQIQTLEQKKSLLEHYKKGVLQKIFKQELRFKDDDGNSFPEWKERKLGDLTYKVGKKNKENIQYPIYSINNQEGFRPQSEQFEGLDSNDRGYDISLYKIVNKETFAYNPARINIGSIGYSYDLDEVIVSSLYVCFKTKKELEDLYLLAYLDTDRFNKDILRYQEGGVRQYLFYENFSQIKIPLPSLPEQTKIANFLSTIDKNIALVTTKIEHTKAYKKGLLQQMFV